MTDRRVSISNAHYLVPYLSATRTVLSSMMLTERRSCGAGFLEVCCPAQGRICSAMCRCLFATCSRMFTSSSGLIWSTHTPAWRTSRNASPNHASSQTPRGWRHRAHPNQCIRLVVMRHNGYSSSSYMLFCILIFCRWCCLFSFMLKTNYFWPVWYK